MLSLDDLKAADLGIHPLLASNPHPHPLEGSSAPYLSLLSLRVWQGGWGGEGEGRPEK